MQILFTGGSEQVVERGNDAILEVEKLGGSRPSRVTRRDSSNAEAQLRLDLERAARLAAAGSSWIREVAETERNFSKRSTKWSGRRLVSMSIEPSTPMSGTSGR